MDDRIANVTNLWVPDWYCILNLGRHSDFRLGASASYEIMDCFRSQGVVWGEPSRHVLICEGPYHCYQFILQATCFLGIFGEVRISFVQMSHSPRRS